jgi:hypothetical protein
MKISHPSREFDDAVAAICLGFATEQQMKALNLALQGNRAAQDDYLFQLELHSRLASDPDLFSGSEAKDSGELSRVQNIVPFQQNGSDRGRKTRTWAMAVAACFVFAAAGLWSLSLFGPAAQKTTSQAVAKLNLVADARWGQGKDAPRLGAPLEPGGLRLEGGLAEIIFYSGARLVVEGPAEIRLVSRNEVFCLNGRLMAEVPDQARGFKIETPHLGAADLEGSFGVEVKADETEVHALKGSIKVMGYALEEGLAARIDRSGAVRLIEAEQESFYSTIDLRAKSAAAGARRHDQWRSACKRLGTDASLVLHYDFENVSPSGWELRNLRKSISDLSDATIVGCQWTDGRWPEKRALEFQSVSDRVRLTVPGEFDALTLTAWVCIKGLDRKINSLFMSDGFEAGTLHWVIRRDGALGMTVIGANPRDHQIIASPRVITLDQFGTWLHLAVSVDSSSKQVVHYINGSPVSRSALKIAPPFKIGPAEVGNWNAKGFPENDPFMIRNFSGAMDELAVFSRALNDSEIRALYSAGRPQPEPATARAAIIQKQETAQ